MVTRTIKRGRKVYRKKGTLLRYEASSRREFIEEIHAMRIGDKDTDPKTYRDIVKILNEHGYRNSKNELIDMSFVGNLLVRYPINK